MLKLDYSIETPEQRAELVKRIIQEAPKESLTSKYLEILSDYIIDAEEKKEKYFLTDNRAITINKRETSFEGLAEKFENGEDGIYNLITNDKNIILSPKISITPQDIEEVPGLKELSAAIENLERTCSSATGRKKFILK